MIGMMSLDELEKMDFTSLEFDDLEVLEEKLLALLVRVQNELGVRHELGVRP